jgi:MSHA biogenesis protein MshJ
MMKQLVGFESWFNGRPARERALLGTAALVVTLLMFEGMWWGEERERAAKADAEVASLELQKAGIAAELEQLEQRESLDPDSAIREQIDVVQMSLADLDAKLRGQTLQILAPEQMPSVLRDLIGNVRGLKIEGIRSELPERLVNSANDNLPVLYRHGLVIDLEGDYLALLDYVRELEELPWRFYWLGMEVRANGTAPRQFRLHVYTVSLREEWIRV